MVPLQPKLLTATAQSDESALPLHSFSVVDAVEAMVCEVVWDVDCDVVAVVVVVAVIVRVVEVVGDVVGVV